MSSLIARYGHAWCCGAVWWALCAAPLCAAPLWVEAEQYAAQFGSRAEKYVMASASGGACVDNDWGGQEGHFLRYQLDLPAEFPALHVTLRYARHTAGEAVVRVTLDGDPAKSVVMKLPSTGDWGFRTDGWKYAAGRLPACPPGRHTLEVRSLAHQNNVNFDGFYLSAEPLDTRRAALEPPSGPEAVAPLGAGLCALPCQTPLALPYSRRKALVSGSGAVQVLLSTPEARGIGGNLAGPRLHVKLAGQGPWTTAEQTLQNSPVPTVVTRLQWPELEVTQAAFAAAPEEQGFFVRVTVKNKSVTAREVELLSLIGCSGAARVTDGSRIVDADRPLLRVLPAPGVVTAGENSTIPGPLGGSPRLRHQIHLAGESTVSFELQFLGAGLNSDEAQAAAAKAWREWLAPAARVQLPDAKLQFAFEASLRQMLTLIESRPDHARVLKGLQHYYGANPYDTFQVSRALDSVGLRATAEELLRHQLQHLKEDGIFEMWETGDLKKPGADQWIVQGLAATALWNHYEVGRDEAWLREMAPTLVKAAQATLRVRQAHRGTYQQGSVAVEGWLPPLGGDGGLGVGYHWSQNAGAAAGVRFAAEAARLLQLPVAAELQAGAREFQAALDTVRQRAAADAGGKLLPAFPGAVGDARTKALWGVVMSVSAFHAIPYDDPAAVGTLRFLQQHQRDGLHLNLGYSSGVWPYLSAEVAQWHAQLGEFDEAWRILAAIVARGSSTSCWYEELDPAAPSGFGDAADVWAAAEVVFLTRALLLRTQGDALQVCPGLPPEWLIPGRRLSAQDLPTPWGRCGFELRCDPSATVAELRFSGARRPAQVRLWLAPTPTTSWQRLEVSGARAHRRDGRQLILEAPDPVVKIEAVP